MSLQPRTAATTGQKPKTYDIGVEDPQKGSSRRRSVLSLKRHYMKVGGTVRSARRSWVALVGMVALSACASSHPVMVGRHEDEISLGDEPGALIQMRRNGCPDEPCPVYSVSVFSDGTAVYDGRANVGVIGRRALKVTSVDLSGLINALDAMDFLDSAENCCVCPDAAAPSLVTLDYRPGTVAKTVVHDQRCPNAPAAVWALERQIDRATGADRLAILPGRRGMATGAEVRPRPGR